MVDNGTVLLESSHVGLLIDSIFLGRFDDQAVIGDNERSKNV